VHDDFVKWYEGFIKNLIELYPNIDGLEAAEGFVDYKWNKEADYNT